MVDYDDIKNAITYIPRAIVTDSQRLYGGSKDVWNNGNAADLDADRRDLIKGAGVFLAAGATPGKDVVEDTADAIPLDLQSPVTLEDNDKEKPSNDPKTGGNAENETDPSNSSIEDYEDFSEGLGQLDQGDIRYLHGALDADPEYVEEVNFAQEGIYFDDVLLEYEEMSNDLEQHLDESYETGNLESWLETYEEEME